MTKEKLQINKYRIKMQQCHYFCKWSWSFANWALHWHYHWCQQWCYSIHVYIRKIRRNSFFFTKEEQIEIDDKNMCLVSCRYDDAKMYALSDTNCIKFSSFSVWERSSLLLFLFLFKHIQFLIAWKKYFVRWKMKDANNNIRMKEDEKLSWNT